MDQFDKERAMLLGTIEALVEANADLRRQLRELQGSIVGIPARKDITPDHDLHPKSE